MVKEIKVTREEFKKKIKSLKFGIAQDLQAALVRNAPSDTGQLRGSIQVVFLGNTVKIQMIDYWKYVEFGCFFDNQIKVLTKKGDKSLKSLKLGDKIFNGKEYSKLIQKEEMDIGYSIKKITINTSFGNLELTEDHPLLTKKGWKKARDLKKSDELVKSDKITLIKIDNIKVEKVKDIKIYNISLEGDKPFFVNGIMTHNTPPHIIRPKDKKALHWGGKGGPVVKKVEHPGTRPQPFVRNTFRNNLSDIINKNLLRISK